MTINLPPMICFRVTRHCNARCGFCLAPPDGINTAADILVQRVDWLLEQGVRTIHFCGGEPTIHPDLPLLLSHVQARGGKTKLTTNGIAISSELISALRVAKTQVKVSLHGDHDHHNAMVGRDAFNQTTDNLRCLVAAGVSTSVQTTVIAGGSWVVDWVAQFCLEIGVRRLSILPFIPRGSGRNHRDDYGLSLVERRLLREQVTQQRRALNTRLDLRWLDFTARPFHVVEPDGRVILEGATEAMDKVICHIPLADAPNRESNLIMPYG